MGERHDLVVVGLGSAGMVAAEFAASVGAQVCAIERDRVGGDCLWTGCVPSKALLAAARAAHGLRTAGRFGLPATDPVIDTAAVLDRVRTVQEDIAAGDDSPERFRQMGVRVVQGAARLTSPTTVAVDGHGEVEGKAILVCTGSHPAVPPVDGLAQAGHLTSETFWQQDRLPRSLVVIGGGPIAVELAQACARLGTEVTVLERERVLLPRDEPQLAGRLCDLLRAEGIAIELGVAVDRVSATAAGKVVHAEERSWTADEVLVATGRTPAVEGLGLEELGIEVGSRGVVVDDGYRTAVKTVYAAGDVAGRHLFTHSAGYEAARVVRNVLFPARSKGSFAVPWTTFTDPELAHAGLTSDEARERHGDDAEVHRLALRHNDRARADGQDDGMLVAVTAKGRIVGAHALAPHAGELIGELALAIEQGLKLHDLAGIVHVYPTISIGWQGLGAEVAYGRARRLRRLLPG